MGFDDASSSSLTLAAVARTAKLPAETVIKRLYDDHAIATVQDLQDVLAHADAAKSLPALWRVRLEAAMKKLSVASSGGSCDETDAFAAVQWWPNREGTGPRIVAMQGDLTACKTDAIVNAANSQLFHGGGLAGAIARCGGSVIDDQSQAWIRQHKSLPVGRAMVTSSGKLPCRYVIHTVGPSISGGAAAKPTPEQAKQLRSAVRSVLCEADKLGLATIAIPGISSGIFGYPRDLAAREIVSECTRFCRARSPASKNKLTTPTTIETIVLMNNDTPTCKSFGEALDEAAGDSLQSFSGGSSFKHDAAPSSLRKTPQSTRPHKASGVMLTRVGENDFEVLVGVEFRALDNVPGRYVNFLGGCMEHARAGEDETPMSTACREFSEEVGGLLTVNQVQRAMEQSSRSVYLDFAKYTLFVTHLDTKRTRSLPDLYAKAKKKASSVRGIHAEHDHLAWVPWRDLVGAATSPSTSTLSPKQRARAHRGLLHTAVGPFPVSDLVQRTMASFRSQIERQLEQLMLKNIFASERERVKSLKGATDGELIIELLESDWKLRLTSPPMPPPAPIELLTPRDAAYRQIIDELDPGTAARVVSVRRVRVSARAGTYQKHKAQVQAIPNANITENEPFYHGTPERWRATAIAMNGFDLSIQLCGRSMGNGVYTSTQVGIAQGYTGGSGSLLRLRGLVVSAPNNSTENTIANDPVYVFPNPKALLPLAIIDYAAEDESDTIAQQQKTFQDESKRTLAKRRTMEKAMAKKEQEFERGTGSRLRAALNVYSARLAACEALMKQNDTLPQDDAIGRHTIESSSMSQKLFLERKHFAACLPIYEVKPRLVNVLHATPVVIVIAETGSGKSTQLPQILLDDVLPITETRRIAILQPRRVNAISLCKRVAEERGCLPGRDVAYTIGRGESNATPGVTRLEFMTHGLFVQLARDYEQLVNKYCAVIVDEAHERSVDVDLSLALLQRALQRRTQAGDKETQKSFRVIVTSATIGKHAQQFQRYLDPSMQQSAIFRVNGRVFPVHVEYRSDVQVEQDAVGTAGVGKVLTSSAIQTAIDLLRTTETGNILIFLPGEGSISDALELARNDIAMSATVEALDVFTSESQAFCFRMSETTGADEEQKDGDRTRAITTCVVGFHGKITRAERDHVLHPRSNDWRLVVFTTNIAETGVTIPNVRYVIDTGLERRVRWNAALDLNEMVTERISLSSMTQRAGRAGRTASGICVRLFPEESASESNLPDVTPGVQNAMIYKAVLLNKQLEDKGEAGLELLDPIDPDLLEQAQERLVSLGALDPANGKLTKEGSALLRIGVDLRLGRFLIACARFGCLATGVKLASVLVAADAPERLLPDRKKPHLAARWDDLVDASGDHITLLNIIEAYEQAEQNGEGIQWCQDKGFELDVFSGAEASKEYLLKVLDALRFPLADDAKAMEKLGGRHTSIRLALCAAYHDQLARPRMDATAKNGFVRVLDDSTSQAMRQNAADFADRTQGRDPSSDDGASDASSDVDSDGEVRSQPASEIDEEPIVKLASRSTLWRDDVASTLAVAGDGLVVFGSLMLTDGATRGEPSVQLVSCVTAEEVQRGAPEWCKLINFERLIASSARETLEFKLDPGMNQTILMDRGSWLTQLKTMFHSAVVATIRKGKLLVSCPKRSLARVEHHVQKQLRTMEAESVVLQLPATVKMGKIIGKGGQQIKALEDGVQEFLSSEHRGAGRHHVQKQRVLSVDSDNKTIQITLQGASKPMMGVVVGRVQSAIVELHGNEMLPLVLDASGERGQQMQQYPRLAQLLNRVAPTNWATRDDVMLQLAHVLVWSCGVSIYGGFLRDWVVRGEAANDIDVQLAPPQTTTDSVEQQLAKFLAESDQANAKRLRITRRGDKGAAFTLTIEGTGISPIDVDLVDPARVRMVVAPPGVDCDAGNLLLNCTESLRKKVPAAGDSLSAALENARQKQFVFFYPLMRGPHQDMSVKRLKKYLSRGWTCLSPVPRAVQREFLTAEERQLIQPESHSN